MTRPHRILVLALIAGLALPIGGARATEPSPGPSEMPAVSPAPATPDPARATPEPVPDPTVPPTPDPTPAPPADPAAIVVRVLDGEVDFGRVNPLGLLDPAIDGLSVTVDPAGATYLAVAALKIEVESPVAWSTDCLPALAEGERSVEGEARLQWRVTGTDAWRPYGLPGTGCSADRPPGSARISWDVRLRVRWTDAPGAIGGALVLAPGR